MLTALPGDTITGMLAVIINTIAVLAGSSIGLIARKAIPKTWNDIILKGMGLVSIYIGITGMLEGNNTLVLVFSIAIGALIGQSLDIDGRFDRMSKRFEEKLDAKGGKSNFAQGFVTSSLIFCVGAIAIVGPLNAALKGDADLLYTKSIMDGFTSMILAASLGVGVLFSSVPVLVIEGGVFLLAAAVAPFLGEVVIQEMTCAGSLVIIGLGLNLLGATNLKVMNFLPAILLPIAFCPLYEWVAGLL